MVHTRPRDAAPMLQYQCSPQVIVDAYHKAIASPRTKDASPKQPQPQPVEAPFIEVLLDAKEGSDQNTMQQGNHGHVHASTTRRFFPSLSVASPPKQPSMHRPSRLSVVDGGLPMHQQDTGAVGAAYAAIKYAAKVARSVPKWVARRTRPILTRLSTMKRTVALPHWMHRASQAVTNSSTVTRIQGASRVRNNIGRISQEIGRMLPASLRRTTSGQRGAATEGGELV